LRPGDRFAWVHWQALQQRLRVSWEEFQEWDLWQVAAGLGLDRMSDPDGTAVLDRFAEASKKRPSPDRRG